MKAVVIEQPGKVVLAEIDPPTFGQDEILVRSHSVGICPTDLKILHGLMPDGIVRYPCIPGHEWSGTVLDGGDSVEGVGRDDRVVCEGMIPCGRCRRCLSHETNLCERYDQIGFTRPGGYAEVVAVPSRVVHRLPETVSLEAGSLIEPASCVLSALDRGALTTGEVVAVIGAGTLGLMTIVLARSLGAQAVFAYGVRDAELKAAKRLGATEVLRPGERTEADIDLVVDTAGGVAAMHTGLDVVRRGGRLVLIGTAGEGERLDVSADIFVRKHTEVIGSLSYTSQAWLRALEFAGTGRLELDRFVAARLPLSDFAGGFAMVERPGDLVGRVVLQHADP
jgi:2-desacetyl-2-hydroxyethyl bacteriochlorophyllide A dehydrogenase